MQTTTLRVVSLGLVFAVLAAGCSSSAPKSAGLKTSPNMGIASTLPSTTLGGQAAPAPVSSSAGTTAPIVTGGTLALGGIAGVSGIAGAAGQSAGSAGISVAGSGGDAAGGGGSAGTGAGMCSSKPGKLHGKSDQMIMVGSVQRTFVYYAPMTLDPNKPAPLVIVPHGFILSGEAMVEITHYTDLADKEGFVAIFPDGVGSTWNFGGSDCGSSILGVLPESQSDDQAFMDSLIKYADADTCIDHAHMFMAGFSMGGYFTNQNGCLRADLAAVAPHSGGSHDLSKCPVMHKPVMILHFNPDGLIPYMCGQKARDRWVQQNGCQTASPDVRMVKGGKCEYYKGCVEKGQVAFCTFDVPDSEKTATFPGHGWSGGSKEGTHGGSSFAIPSTESATNLTWNFFKEFAW